MKPPAVVHVDLDGAVDIFHSHGWPYEYADDPVFETGMRAFLDFFDRAGVRATLFTIASSLDQPSKRDLLREAVRRGHEIASHTVTHPMLRSLDSGRKEAEIRGSRAQLEEGLGVRVRGFRAPGYQIDREALRFLAGAGYAYDSSSFPTADFAQRLGVSEKALASPFCPLGDSPLVELPLPDYRPSPVPFSPSYALLLGRPYFRWGVDRCAANRKPLVLLFHLIDLAEPLSRERAARFKPRLFTLSLLSAGKKRNLCSDMMNHVLRRFRVIDTESLLRECEADVGRPDQGPGVRPGDGS